MATITVINTNDSGAGSLRQAILDAKAAGGSSTINFDPLLAGDTLKLTSGELDITSNITIDGGNNNITVDAQGNSRVFDAVHGTSTINGLTITGGYAGNTRFDDGGAIQVGTSSGFGGAELTISNSTITGSNAAYGGGIAINEGDSLQLTNSTVSGDSALYVGGGIANQGALTLTNSTVSNDSAGYIGGGIASAGELTLTNSTLSGNQITASAGGGLPGYASSSAGAGLYNIGAAGLYNTTISNNTGASAGGGIDNGSDLTLTNVTLADNSATYGGGLYNAACGCGDVSMFDSTVTGNEASQSGGGIYNAAGSLTLTNSIVAGNGASSQGPDLAGLGTTNYSGVNLFSQSGIGRPGTDIYVSPSDLSQVFAGTLANNGGAVQTVLITQGGAAEDAGDVGALPPDSNDLNNNGNTAEPLPVDARGDPRAVEGTLDLGAVELQVPRPVISNPDAVIAVAGTGPIALDIAAPTDSDGTTPIITLNSVPTYGTVQYFNGTTFVTVTAGTMLTPAELASLRIYAAGKRRIRRPDDFLHRDRQRRLSHRHDRGHGAGRRYRPVESLFLCLWRFGPDPAILISIRSTPTAIRLPSRSTVAERQHCRGGWRLFSVCRKSLLQRLR